MAADEIQAPFDAAGAEYAAFSPVFWGPLGEALVEHARPVAGERVLDACCGAGASAVPAAWAVGTGGRVDAVDLAGVLLDHGRAATAGLPQLRFTRADVTAWRTDDGPYDLVQVGFGVFFLPDMDAGAKHLVGLLRDGGRLAVQTWRRGALRDFGRQLFAAVQEVAAEPLPAPRASSAAERVDTAERLHGWLASLGLTSVQVREVPFELPLTHRLAWQLVVGTGFRGLLARFDDDGAERVRASLLRRIEEHGLRALDAGSLVARGRRG